MSSTPQWQPRDTQLTNNPIAHLGEGKSSSSYLLAAGIWAFVTVIIFVVGRRFFLKREKEKHLQRVQAVYDDHERMVLPAYYTCIERTPSYISLCPGYIENGSFADVEITIPAPSKCNS